MTMKRTTLWTALALFCASMQPLVCANAATPACTNCFEKRWIYFGGNITTAPASADARYKKLLELIHVAKAEGYNGIAFNPGANGSFASMLSATAPPPDYYPNYAEIVRVAKENGIELIPVGGGLDMPVTVAPELIEALPVNDTLFTVQDGVAVPSGQALISDSSFENRDTAWQLIEEQQGGLAYDTENKHSGHSSIKFKQKSSTGNARLLRKLSNLRPHAAYRLSFWMASKDYDAPLGIRIYGEGATPMYLNVNARLGWGSTGGTWNSKPNVLEATQEWKQYNLDFNTGNNATLNLYFMSEDNGKNPEGTAWLDDVELREIGLAQTIRRKPQTLPVTVTSADGSIRYAEWQDDQRTPADYIVGVESLTIPATSMIREGQVLRVSSYQSGENMTSRWSTPASACHEKFFDIQKKYFDKTYALLSAPQKFFLYYDENRVMNWDPACGNITAGKYLANTIARHQQVLQDAYPSVELYVWNDMFDRKMNAVPNYWVVNGDLTESWKGLKTSTVVVNWTGGSNTKYAEMLALKKTSLEFFHALGHQQMIAGYYDDKSTDLDSLTSWLDALTAAQANGVNSVNGFMYTTWEGVDGYANVKKVADFIKSRQPQRWPQQ